MWRTVLSGREARKKLNGKGALVDLELTSLFAHFVLSGVRAYGYSSGSGVDMQLAALGGG